MVTAVVADIKEEGSRYPAFVVRKIGREQNNCQHTKMKTVPLVYLVPLALLIVGEDEDRAAHFVELQQVKNTWVCACFAAPAPSSWRWWYSPAPRFRVGTRTSHTAVDSQELCSDNELADEAILSPDAELAILASSYCLYYT
ncbi:hypothetical protein PR202_ga19894 [Eleusine coracana subsp. coracana]|uniref:Uncharacterized protein n=1 Tax=Eleusine coracana subsp. coracana TaxID=191504 RepID=A0AAV5CX98_ELECO|nr:hypothetical protein PR202_ga19894 [Eleusine coracana subsp. coracana]